MTNYKRIVEKNNQLTKKLSESSGLELWLVENILQYANQMPKVKGGDVDLLIFTAQMSSQFQINSLEMIKSMYEISKKTKSPAMTVEEYARCICLFLSDQLEEKIDYVFSVYDINRDGFIEWLEVYTWLQSSMVPSYSATAEENENESEENLRDLVDMVIKVIDLDKNRVIDRMEFRTLVGRDKLYLELLGHCLPSAQCIQSFKNKLAGKTPYQVSEFFASERRNSLNEIKLSTKNSEEYYPILLDIP